jgi:hypothetical protein
MMKRVIALTAFGAGYVVGAAAGRERYEQIRRIALRIKDDPHVQRAVDDLGDLARQEAGAVADKVTGHHLARESIPT